MEPTWRWYGPEDPVKLSDIRQAGATGIVTALHHIPIGNTWSMDEIDKRKREIEFDDKYNPAKPRGLNWSVAESIPVHESIKLGKPDRDKYIENYQKSIENLGKAGVKVVCYNFMPVLDWTRTQLDYELEDGARALRFEMNAFIAFDVFILKRKNAQNEYSAEQIATAELYFKEISEDKRKQLTNNIIAGLPGGQEGYNIDSFREKLSEYENVTESQFRKNLLYFLKKIVPCAEANHVKMAIHPDDPPRSLFGLPRVVSTENDMVNIIKAVPSKYNGITFCTGSLGVNPNNDLVGMVQNLGDYIHFAHLRSTQRDFNGNFYEANHLGGNVDMYGVILGILREQQRRKALHRIDYQIPMRADHGHTIMDDLHKDVNPGYSGIGLLRGMSELRGLEMGIEKSHGIPA